MSGDTLGPLPDSQRRSAWEEAPRIVATLIVVGLSTLALSAFFFGPAVEESREEVRCVYFPRICRNALAQLNSTPIDQRLVLYPVLGRVPPNLVIVDLTGLNEDKFPVRAAISEPDGQVVRVFIANDDKAPLTDGEKDYTFENMAAKLAGIRSQRRWQMITMVSVWLLLWVSLCWLQFRTHAQRQQGLSP